MLDVLAGPDVGAHDTSQDGGLVLDNGQHHNPVQDGANQTSHDLNGESVPWWQVNVLGQLQVTGEKLCLLHRVEGEAGEVHVSQGSAGEHVTSQGLANRLNVELETSDTVLSSKEEEENGHHDGADQETPPWKSRFQRVEAAQADSPGDDENSAPPPKRDLLVHVAEHELVMGVKLLVVLLSCEALLGSFLVLPEFPGAKGQEPLEIGWLGPLPSIFDIVEIPQQHVDESRGETHVGGDEISEIGGREEGGALGGQQLIVDLEVAVENGRLVVDVVDSAV